MTIPAIDLDWTLGDRFRKIRRELKMTQDQMAEALHLSSAAAWGNWETDVAKPRNLVELAELLERTFQVPRGWLLFGEVTDQWVGAQRRAADSIAAAQRALDEVAQKLPRLDSNQQPAGYLAPKFSKNGINRAPMPTDAGLVRAG